MDRNAWEFPQPTHSESALVRSKESGEYWERHAMQAPETDTPCLITAEERFVPWRTLRDAIGDLPSPAAGAETGVRELP